MAVPGSEPVVCPYRTAPDVPGQGLSALVLVRPGTRDARRSVAALVAQALTGPPAAA